MNKWLIYYYIDDFRKSLAYIIHPATKRRMEDYDNLVTDIEDIQDLLAADIPEVKNTCEWLLGKNWARQHNHPADAVQYPYYMKYKSLMHFRDVLVNEYYRKVK